MNEEIVLKYVALEDFEVREDIYGSNEIICKFSEYVDDANNDLDKLSEELERKRAIGVGKVKIVFDDAPDEKKKENQSSTYRELKKTNEKLEKITRLLEDVDDGNYDI